MFTRTETLLVFEENFNIHSWFDGDGGDLLHNLGWGVQVNNTFVDAHFIPIPGVGTFTIWCLTGGDTQVLGWQTNWARSFKFFCWALFFKSAQTFSRFFTFLDVRVIRIRKILESSDSKVLAFIMLDMFSDNTNAGRGLLVTDNYLILNMLELDFFDSFFLFLCCVSFKLALYCSK